MKHKGFTLVEMMAVIAVLGLLVVLILPNVLKSYRDAKKVSFINEAKTIYKASTDKYVKEKTKGNKIGLIQKENDNVVNELALNEASDLSYTIRLDSEGRVTAFKLSNSEFCIVGVGDFLGTYEKENVIELDDEERAGECNVTAIQNNQKFILRLQNKETVKNNYNPRIIYLKYNVGWFSDNNLHNSIDSVTIPEKENYYYEGAWSTNTLGTSIQAINCDGTITQDKTGGGIFTGKEPRPYVEAFSRFTKKYYQVAFSGGENSTGTIATLKCDYGSSECKLSSNVDENGYGKDIKKTGYLFKGWKSGTNTYTDAQTLPVLTDENEDSYPYYKFDNDEVCNGTQNKENTLTFTADWEPIKYQVKYDCNGGSNPASNSNHTYDLSANLNANTCTRSGHAFLGWSRTKTGNKEFDNSGSVKNLTTVNNDVVTLYAVWQACGPGQYLAGNTCTACQKDYYSIDTANASCTKCPDGYTTSSTGSNKKAACTINCAADYIVAQADQKCTTKCDDGYNHDVHIVKGGETSPACSANKYYVKYNANGGAGSMENSEHIYGIASNLSPNAFAKSGSKFIGWATSSAGNVAYSNSQAVSDLTTVKNGVVELFAKWQSTNNCSDITIAQNNCDNAEITYLGYIVTNCATSCPGGPSINIYDSNGNKTKTLYYNDVRGTYAKEYGNFGVALDTFPNRWSVYARTPNVFYSYSPTSTRSGLHQLGAIRWEMNSYNKIYLYKINCVKSPTNIKLVGKVNTLTLTGTGGPKISVYDNGTPNLLTYDAVRGTYAKFYSGFGVTLYSERWTVYAIEPNMFISTSETTNANNLSLLTMYQWDMRSDKDIYIYKKECVNTPQNMTFRGIVNTASQGGTGGPKSNGYNATNKTSELMYYDSMRGGRTRMFSGFSVLLETQPNRWGVSSTEDNMYYSTHETHNASDLSKLSMVDWETSTNKLIYIYKKNTINPPTGTTYLGEVHTSSTGGTAGPRLVVFTASNNKSEELTFDQMQGAIYKNYNNFGVAMDRLPSKWAVFSRDPNVYYSFEQTNKMSDLIPLSLVEWETRDNNAVYLYRKNTVSAPANTTFLGKVNTATLGATAGPKANAADAITNQSDLLTYDAMRGGRMQDYTGFGVTLDISPDSWSVYARQGNIYYSTKETTNMSDLHPLSMYQWDIRSINAIYVYRTSSVKTPSNMTFVGEAHVASTGGAAGPKAVVYDASNNTSYNLTYNDMRSAALRNYTNFSFGMQGADNWIIKPIGSNIYYSTKETTNASDLTPLSSVTFSIRGNGIYYLYKKK